ncbi:MAG: hypothetical protein ACRCVT_03695 [Leadbetterella sp.]
MKVFNKYALAFLGVITLSLSGCKDDPDAEEENELITTVKINLKEGNNTSTFASRDLDGDGGNAPVIDKITLKPNTMYTATVEVLDESKSPSSNITNEIFSKGDEHFMVYTPNPANLLNFTITDKDVKNLPIGLSGTLRSNAAANNGKLRVVLYHQPAVNGVSVKNGTSTAGSSDFDVTFDVEIK